MLLRLIILSLITCFCLPLFAQRPGKRIKKRAVERTEKKASTRLDDKIDRGVDNVFNAVEGLFGKKKTGKRGTAAIDTSAAGAVATTAGAEFDLFGTSEVVSYRNDVLFSLKMETTEINNNGREKSSTIYLGATETQVAMVMQGDGDESSQVIYNTETGKTTTITTDKKGKKSGFRMRMPNFGKAAAEAVEEMPDYITFEATEEHRRIDGYDCRKIIVTDSKHGTVTTSWVTTDIALTPKDVYGSLAGVFGGGKLAVSDAVTPVEGFAILSSTDDGKKTMKTHIMDIRLGTDLDRSLFDTTGVAIQEL